MLSGFREKYQNWRERSVDGQIIQRDLWRFVIVIVLLVLSFYVYKLENGVQMEIARKIVGREKIIEENTFFEKSNSVVTKMYDDILLNQMVSHFPEVGGGENIGLGDYMEDKNGYLHSYEDDRGFFEVFLPVDFSENTIITKDDVTFLLQPLGSNLERSFPVKVDEKLVYDEVYPAVAVIKSFSNNGLRDYMYIKEGKGASIYNYRLNVSDGSYLKMDNNQLLILDQNNEVKIVLKKVVVTDADNNLVGVEEKLIGDDILEIRINKDTNVKYPLLVNFS